jgi:Ca2+-transporting ATPase
MKLEDFIKKHNTSLSGLTGTQANENKIKFGVNKITVKKRESFFHILLLQLGSFFSVVLFGAAFILLFLGEMIEFYVVLTIISINSLIETIQRYKSDSIFESLTKMLPSYSLVLRNGKHRHIDSLEIVVGDILILQSGDKIPVDGLVVRANECRVDEAILTGESKPLLKTQAIEFNLDSIMENSHMVFSGSYVTTGTAEILVARVGDKTQIGLMAQKISTIDTELPIYKNIKRLSRQLFAGILLVATFVFFIGLTQSNDWIEILKLTVAICVSAIPESLPVTITLILAYGFKRMGESNVLVKKMQSLDVLGQIDTLALDKTGTITRNQMKVEKLSTLDGAELYVSGDGYNPTGTFVYQNKTVSLAEFPDIQKLITYATLSSTGLFDFDEEKKEWILQTGDPTELALLVLGNKSGFRKEDLLSEYVFQKNIPFNNQSMYHASFYKKDKKSITIYTGAPEVIFAMSTHVQTKDGIKKINDAHTKLFHAKLNSYSSGGYRSIATTVEEKGKIIFQGLFAINDSVRLDVADSVEHVYSENIKIIIITGDHKDIAIQVAKRIGMEVYSNSVLTGDDMNNLTDIQIKNILAHKSIFARVSPQQKLKILELLKQSGRVVAMTGDGVNDSLALVKADIGIAMGTLSSESAKAASDIVLLDNKFGSIVYGIQEGKNIFSNIKKTILFLLSTNFAEMALTVFAISLALPLPLSAAGILWVNFVTDTFLAIGFAFERGVLQKHKKNVLVSLRDWARIFYLGCIMMLISLFVFISNLDQGGLHAQSVTLLVLIVMQWFNVLNIRAGHLSVFKYGFKINRMFILGWAISASLTFFAFNSEFMRNILHIEGLDMYDFVYVICCGVFVIIFEEIRKFFKNKN